MIKLKKISFIISEKEGRNYAKKSGDYNLIHLDDETGYNSLFGKKICHGNLIIEKIFQEIGFTKIPFHCCSINFYSPFFYKEIITCKLLRKNNKIFSLEIFQDKDHKGSIIFDKQKDNFLSYTNYKENYKLKIKNNNIKFLLKAISKYVGMIFPGENSIILNIKIFQNNFLVENSTKNIFFSNKPKKFLPLINNYLITKKYSFFFQTADRPKINNISPKLNNKHINLIKKIKNNCIIIGGSQGLGKEYSDILKKNSKIKIFSTFTVNKNKNNKNLNYFKFDINLKNDLKKIEKVLIKNNTKYMNIYYFASCKIKFNQKLSKNDFKFHKKFFLDFPIEFIKTFKNFKINFYYPSTSNISENPKTDYSKIKKNAEKMLKSICNQNNIKFKTYRFPKINSRQTVSLLDANPKKLVDYMNNNYIRINKLFFLD
jgi:hypothetical protein